jgi:hypothetical protein
MTNEQLAVVKREVAPLIVETRRGMRLSPLVTIENRSTFYTSRAKLNLAPKRAVAMHIYEKLLDELDSVFMDAGSANGAIAEEMAYGEKKNFTILTNNVRAVRTFLANPTIRTFVTGGAYDVEDEALVGRRAAFNWTGLGFNVSLVGVSALSTHYVYNHGVTGEEWTKAHYWQIPADHLVVPAALDKFKGQDAACFGRLFREPERKPEEQPHDPNSIDVIAKAALDHWRVGPPVEHHVPGFLAKRCTIVIEPEWMINELYRRDEATKAELLSAVDKIRGDRVRTHVDIVHADIKEDLFFESYPDLKIYFGKAA